MRDEHGHDDSTTVAGGERGRHLDLPTHRRADRRPGPWRQPRPAAHGSRTQLRAAAHGSGRVHGARWRLLPRRDGGGQPKEPQWIRNLRATPTATIQVGRRADAGRGRGAARCGPWRRLGTTSSPPTRASPRTSRSRPPHRHREGDPDPLRQPVGCPDAGGPADARCPAADRRAGARAVCRDGAGGCTPTRRRALPRGRRRRHVALSGPRLAERTPREHLTDACRPRRRARSRGLARARHRAADEEVCRRLGPA